MECISVLVQFMTVKVGYSEKSPSVPWFQPPQSALSFMVSTTGLNNMCLHAMFVVGKRGKAGLWVGQFEIRNKRKFTRIPSDTGFDRRPKVLSFNIKPHYSNISPQIATRASFSIAAHVNISCCHLMRPSADTRVIFPTGT